MTLDRSFRSPNHSSRQGRSITMLVIHATAGNARSALSWLTHRASRVSAHYLIDKGGRIYQLVPDDLAAWHAGRASWRGATDINERSIGIELENANDGRDPYPPEQLNALVRLAREKVAQYGIAPDMVVRHCDVAVPRGRKTDPAAFPWADFLGQLFPQAPPARPDRPPRPQPPREGEAILARALYDAAYRQVGAVDRPGWAFSRVARSESLGMPIGPSFDFAVAGRSYIGQSFGAETLASPIGEWQRIERLGALVTPEQQPLREALLEAVYAQAGETYHPDWAFHQYALRTPVGPPLGPSVRLTVAGEEYVSAGYALDTLFSPVGRWRAIGRLSQNSSRPLLTQALLEQLYARVGSQLQADWPLHEYALREQLGAPLGRSFRVSAEGRDYVAESYARDVIYCEVGDWQAIGRLSALPPP